MNKFGKMYVKTVPIKANGDAFSIRLMVEHPMESGYRHDRRGKIIPRNIIKNLRCDFNGETIFAVELSSAVSRNPMFQFLLRPGGKGVLTCLFIDEFGNEKSKLVSFVD